MTEKKLWRGAFRILYSSWDTKANTIGEALVMEEGPSQYNVRRPWKDFGATKTGFSYQYDEDNRRWIYGTNIAEPRDIRRTCDVPIFLGASFALVLCTHSGANYGWTCLSKCELTDKCLDYVSSEEVKENFKRMGEPSTIPIEFYFYP